MTRQLTWSIVADGGTDRLLVPIIRWAIHRLDPHVEVLEPDFLKRHGTVEDDLQTYDFDTMLIFVHRDSESASFEERLREFASIRRSDVVPVVPVQMSEAWILFDGAAIAGAAGSPLTEVPAPGVANIESESDPKQRLDELLFQAAGTPTGRRGRNFRRRIAERRVSVAGNISDFSPLERVPAFRRFQSVLADRYPYRYAIEE